MKDHSVFTDLSYVYLYRKYKISVVCYNSFLFFGFFLWAGGGQTILNTSEVAGSSFLQYTMKQQP